MKPWYCLGMALLACVRNFAEGAEEPFPEGMVTLRGQPAVFVVAVEADVEAEYPKSATLDLRAIREDLGTVKGAEGAALTDADRAWILLGNNPDKYLRASEERVRSTISGAVAQKGSAFAISREGILLTNAHVVTLAVERHSPDNWSLIQPSIVEDCQTFERALGVAGLGDGDVRTIMAGLFRWYAPRVEVVASRSRSIRVVLDFKVNQAKASALLRQRGLIEAISLKPEEISVPATVLALGEPMPGKDVAVLKVTFAPEEQARLVKISRERKLPPGTLEAWLSDIQGDRLICLPLGNSEDVLPQDRVQALGLPANAFNADAMEAEARFRVSSRGGQFSQSKRMKAGWDAFEMTAAINHGDSGGPVLDTQGRVIAINVGAASQEPGAICMAVPINVAKEYLAKAGVKPDPGPLSILWEKALRLYAKGEYQACYDQVQAVIRMQKGSPLANRKDREASYYVWDMAGRCLQKLGKIPNGN